MWDALKTSWALFFGMLLLMVSNGLLVTLLTLRGTELGFGDTTIGLMQSGYPAGALFGCIYAPRLVAKVGHIRAFAALASLASTAALVHLVTLDPWSWGAMRALSGFCFSGLYVVSESWLNGRATNRNRASLLSIYFVIQTGGSAAGQLLLNLSSPSGVLLFVVTSILVSLSLVPILISATRAPTFEAPERISLRALFKLSPMGLTGSFLNGIAQGTLYVGLAVFGAAIALPPGQVGMLVGAATVGGMLLQVPVARLSDRLDRRIVILGVALLALPLCFFLAASTEPGSPGGPASGKADWGLLLCLAALGGLILPIYSLCIAHTNDYLRPGQVVPASGTLVLVLNGGIIIGPTAGAWAVGQLGPAGLFYLLALLQGLTALAGVIRLMSGRARAQSPGRAVAVSHSATPLAAQLNPEADSKDE
ncbi:MAG: MFS transporter [Pseudomonadota bacterium]